VFDKQYLRLFPRHCPYNLSIQTEEAIPSLEPIYSLLVLELQSLKEFLNKNLKTSIIHPLQFPGGAQVLFVKKKNRALQLCIDYRGLNYITQKNKYLILLITDLLDALKRARVYSKINLRNAYYLVCIVEGNEWKTYFRT